MLLTPLKKATLDWFLLHRISKLSVRTRNGLKDVSPTLNPDQIYAAISQPEFNFINIRNIGRASVEEFDELKNELTNFIETLLIMGDRELNIKYVELVLINLFNPLPEDLCTKIDLLFDDNNKLKLFGLLKYLIHINAVFSERDNKIFQLCFTIHNNENLNADSISDEYELTEERVRQIKVEIEKNIQNYFSFVSNFPADILVNYGIDGESQFYAIDDIFSNQLNVGERINFNKAFYGVILGNLVKNSHKVIGNNQVIYGESRGQRKYENTYLIRTEIVNSFHFTQFLKGMYLLKQKKTNKAIFIELKGLLIKYLRSADSRAYLDDILAICKTLILKELDLAVDQYGYVKFERNARMSIPDYAHEIFEELSHPLTIEQLIDAINNKYPNTVTSPDSVRTSLNKRKDQFIYFSRTSTYGLRNWEVEMDNILGGTISDIVEKYLKRSQRPRHFADILHYVIKYRPETNISSLRANLALETGRRFKLYSSQYVGLQSNVRRDKGFKVKKIIGTHFMLKQFENMRGWTYDRIVRYYVNEFDYDSKTVKFVLDRKIEKGTLNFSTNKVLL